MELACKSPWGSRFSSSTHLWAAWWFSIRDLAGATESLLSLETWEELARANPLLASLATDVEALLVRNVQRRGGFECYIVPIDACYELVGRIRRRWKGFDGGEEAWKEIDGFFADVRGRSTEAHAEAVDAG